MSRLLVGVRDSGYCSEVPTVRYFRHSREGSIASTADSWIRGKRFSVLEKFLFDLEAGFDGGNVRPFWISMLITADRFITN